MLRLGEPANLPSCYLSIGRPVGRADRGTRVAACARPAQGSPFAIATLAMTVAGCWLLALAVVLIADLAIGVWVGWLWRNASVSRQERSYDRDPFERMFRRNDELFRVLNTLLRQSREYVGRLDDMRNRLTGLPNSTTTRIVSDLIESVREMHGDLSTTHDRLQRQLNLSEQATSAARHAFESSVSQKPAASLEPALIEIGEPAITPAVVTPPNTAPADARQEERRPYCYQQSVAPYVRGRIPTPQMFQSVQCCDLSSGGASFLTPDRPTCDMIVITIGDERHLVYRTARVVQVSDVVEKSGRMFRVGCQFTGRLHRHLFA